ncbi:MAG TPA: CapA family protein, partial [bacterium]|nr:CapA family protein [bacterium]
TSIASLLVIAGTLVYQQQQENYLTVEAMDTANQTPVVYLDSDLPEMIRERLQTALVMTESSMQPTLITLSPRAIRHTYTNADVIIGTQLPDLPGYTQITAIPISLQVAAVHFTNPLQSISADQLDAIASGTISNWKELGGHDQPISFFAASDTSDLTQILAALHTDPGAIGIIPASALEVSIRHLAIDGFSPMKVQDASSDLSSYPLAMQAIIAYRTDGTTTTTVSQSAYLSTLLEKSERVLRNETFSPEVITLKAVGDMMLSRHVGTKIREAGDTSLPFRKTAAFLSDADITFGNMEAPFYDQGPPKTEGMVFKAEPDTIAGLQLAGFDIVDLANNHFGNQGREGMEYTFQYLTENNIRYYGAGYNYDEAHTVKIIETDG